MPGKDWVEVEQIYLQMGIRPENIYGVEKDESVFDDFESKAKELKCHFSKGEVDQFLASREEGFDIVSLDFLGSAGLKNLTTIQLVQIKSGGCFISNFLAKREQSESQINLSQSHNYLNFLANPTYEAASDFTVKDGVFYPNAETHVSESRDLGLTGSVMRSLQECIVSPRFNSFVALNNLTDESLEYAFGSFNLLVSHIFPLIDKLLCDFVCQFYDLETIQVLGKFESFLKFYLFEKPLPKEVERFRYRSSAGAKNSNYFTDMFFYSSKRDVPKIAKPHSRFAQSIERMSHLIIKSSLKNDGELATPQFDYDSDFVYFDLEGKKIKIAVNDIRSVIMFETKKIQGAGIRGQRKFVESIEERLEIKV